ncbi:S1 RNA-binding domain-containing protein [Mesorhizobium sp. M7A.F.Ca.MR.148.00.0.0]|uniref:S1 RNA-binding domain-containing protein n=1 Tax=Mesorhizobium sp. M7A.F.Ca.MR.148.00.0.0 TaxID=2496775 RepID=UPI000FCBB755|nr:S1 RNA-binding domain-containing protein [Mesorhizobium sp. M7A.F.Ca.MR.148.00.0.0]RUV39557.1 S1 RNA-binding domain-containing protein [Mesorhizobium sp. M7A.F.Ca.MR.148.00.0.0]
MKRLHGVAKMDFEKPDLSKLENERDVEHKFLYPLLIGEAPSGLGFDPAQVSAQKNLRKFTIGKGSDLKSYVPDYLVTQGTIPLLVVEGKKPGADVFEAFREARLYASELNAIHPSGLNPASRVIASNGNQLLAGWHDQAKPVLDISFDQIDRYSPQMSELIKLFGSVTLEKYYTSLLPVIKPSRYWKPVKLVGGLAKQKEQVPVNSFGATITTDFAHLFNPQSRADRSVIARQAYISSKRRERYIEPIDKVIRAATPPSVSNSKTLEDTGNPAEIIKPFRNARALEHKVMLLIGSAGAGKSTFVDYLQDVALPSDIRSKTLWIRVDMNPAPISRDEIYPWLREEIIRGCIGANPKINFASLEGLKAVHSIEVNDFRKGVGRLYSSTPGLFDSKLADMLTALMANRHAVAVNTARYCSTEKGILLIIVLDNSDKRLREEQLLMFEAAQWLQREFRGLVLLPLREETYDNHRNEPPLDTALKDLVFRIEPPLFQRILASRVNLALRELAKSGEKLLRYDLPNGIQVEYPASDQGYYFSSIVRSIFEHDRYVRRLIVGLSGRNMRRALEIFLEFCTSGHIGTDEITKIRLSEGRHVLPLSLVTSVLLRANQRFYDSDASYLKNVFAADFRDSRPHFFARLLLLRVLLNIYNSPGNDRMKGYVRVALLRNQVAAFGVEEAVFRRELEYLVRGFCIVCEDFRVKDITDDDLVAIAPAGHVHERIYLEQYYLAAIAEDSWFEKESVASRIANRIGDTKQHYTSATVLENAEDLLEELEMHRSKEVAAYRSIFDNDDLAKLIDLSAARSKLSRFEAEIAANGWAGANKRFPVGSAHHRSVANTAAFGVFVQLEPGLDGLVHSSKLPMDFRTNSAFQRGQKVHVSILHVDRVEGRAELELVRENVLSV